MPLNRSGSVIKCDQNVNITATFGAELLLKGITSIPNILLKVYSRVGISDFQMMLLIHLIRLKVEERKFYPAPEIIAQYMESDPYKIKNELAVLLEKEMIAVSDYYDSERNVIFKGYDFEPLFLKVSDIWAGIRAGEIEESEKLLKSVALGQLSTNYDLHHEAAGLISTFEKEFGRLFSPFEVEQIEQWHSDFETTLVIEALKRAVLRGKHNLKYINGILAEWKKNKLLTIQAIEEYEQDFLRRRAGRGKRASDTGSNPEKTEGKNVSKKKAFLKTLYV
ncbi:MAG: DnaD domain protein [Desulfotomaculaceae bacterium]|nr:DnaD domain protein [Desulfotomaculaceae bacterium]